MRQASWLVLLVLGVIPAGQVRSADVIDRYSRTISGEDGLVAYWRFEGDCRDSRGAAHGEPRGGAPVFEKGPGGGECIVLGDGRFVTMGETPHLDLDETTIELWFQPRFPPGLPYNPCIIAKRMSSPRTRVSVHIMSDYSQIAVWNGRQVIRFAPPRGSIRRGEWVYLAVTSTGDTLQVYLDAVPCSLVSDPGTFTRSARGLPLGIGSSAPEGVELLQGALDEVAIYARALAIPEIEAHMDAMAAKRRLTKDEIAAEIETKRRALDRAADERLQPYIRGEALFGRGEPRVYRDEHLAAVSLPVGGIGAGSVAIDGRAVRPVWQISGNVDQASLGNTFFALAAKEAGKKPVLRALQTEPVGPFQGMKAITFRGEYPFGWFEFEDPGVPVRVSLETFNPLIPLDLKGSAIPCAIYNITVANPGPKTAEASLLASQRNAVGYTRAAEQKGRPGPWKGGNLNRVLREGPLTILHMTSRMPEDEPGNGDMALLVSRTGTTATATWTDLGALADDLAGDGALAGPDAAGPAEAGHTLDGALAVPFKLEPGEERTAHFALTWHFPDTPHGHGKWGGRGNMYENWWPDALAVARDLARRRDDLTRRTRLYHDTLYASNLPWWLLDRMSAQLVVLRSQTCFWTRDGYFGGWEGLNPGAGCCYGNCNHVWQYAQAHARLFPELGRILREQEFRFQSPEGAIPHRQPASHPAFDGQCGAILGAYREHLMSSDGTWLSRVWGNVKRAMEYVISRWDADEDGVPSGPQWNTLDGNLGGSTSWLGTMYLGALAAAERMARIQGDEALEGRCRRIRESGSRKQNGTLFNGEYYIQIPDTEPQEDYLGGCHIDQLLGQWWAHQLDLGWLYPPERVRTAMRSLFGYNFRTHFHGIPQLPRRFVADDDPGMQMITWPKGGRPARQTRYASEVMSGFEYAAAATMVQAGLLREGLTVVRAAAIRYDGRLRTGLSGAAWGYSGNPFCDDECGKFYARPMSIWSMMLACQGYVYDGPGGRIGFRPAWRPEDHASFFIAAEGWGLFTQRRSGRVQVEEIAVRDGELGVKSLVFELPDFLREPRTVKVTRSPGKADIPAAYTVDGNELRVELESREVIPAGSSLVVVSTGRG